MLLDLRVVLALCLATLIFLITGFGLAAVYRTPFKASGGPLFSGPGLPSSRPLPVTLRTPVTPNKPIIEEASKPVVERKSAIETKPAFETIQMRPTAEAKSAIEAKATIEDLLATMNERDITGSVNKEPTTATPPVPKTVAAPAPAPTIAAVPASIPVIQETPPPPPSAVMPIVAPVPPPAPEPPPVVAVEHAPKTPPKAVHHGVRKHHGHATLTPADKIAQPAGVAGTKQAVQPKKKRHRVRRVKKKPAPPSNNPFASFMNKTTAATPAR